MDNEYRQDVTRIVDQRQDERCCRVQYGSQKRHVFFNLNKQEEREMFQYSSRLNFSGWVKQQLAKEMKRQKPEATIQVNLGGDRK